MAFAFLAYGSTNDNNHSIEQGSLHLIHYAANQPSRRGSWHNSMGENYVALIMDLVSFAFVYCCSVAPPFTNGILAHLAR